jgi:hypothetical protein
MQAVLGRGRKEGPRQHPQRVPDAVHVVHPAGLQRCILCARNRP